MTDTELKRWPLKLAQTLGYSVGFNRETQQAFCVLEMDDLHRNPSGTIHGGITATMLDTAGGLTASLSENPDSVMPALTMTLTINYVSAVASGRLRAVGRVAGGGRKTKFVDCELRDDADALIATSTGVFKLLPDQREGGGK